MNYFDLVLIYVPRYSHELIEYWIDLDYTKWNLDSTTRENIYGVSVEDYFE